MPKPFDEGVHHTPYLSEEALSTATQQQGAGLGMPALRPPLTFPLSSRKELPIKRADGGGEGGGGVLLDREGDLGSARLNTSEVGDDASMHRADTGRAEDRINPTGAVRGPASSYGGGGFSSVATRTASTGSVTDSSLVDVSMDDEEDDINSDGSQGQGEEGSAGAVGLGSPSIDSSSLAHMGATIGSQPQEPSAPTGTEDDASFHYLRRPRPTPPPSVSVDGPVGDEDYEDAMDDDQTYLTAPSAKAERARQEEEQGSLCRNTSSSSMASTSRSSLQPTPCGEQPLSSSLNENNSTAAVGGPTLPTKGPLSGPRHRYTLSVGTLSSDGGFDLPSSIDGGSASLTVSTSAMLTSEREYLVRRYQKHQIELRRQQRNGSDATSSPKHEANQATSTSTPSSGKGAEDKIRAGTIGSGDDEQRSGFGSDTTQPTPPTLTIRARTVHGSLAPDRPPTPLRKKCVKISEQDIASFAHVDVDEDNVVEEDETVDGGDANAPGDLIRQGSDATTEGPPRQMDTLSEDQSAVMSYAEEGLDDRDSVITVRGGSTTVEPIHRVTRGNLIQLQKVANDGFSHLPATSPPGLGSAAARGQGMPIAVSDTGIIRPVSKYRDTVDMSSLASEPIVPAKHRRREKLSATVLMNSIAASGSLESPFSPIPAYYGAAQFPSYQSASLGSLQMIRPATQRVAAEPLASSAARSTPSASSSQAVMVPKAKSKSAEWALKNGSAAFARVVAQAPAQTATTLLDPTNTARLESQWLHFRKFVSPYESDRTRYRRYPKPTFVNFHPALWRWLVKNSSTRKALDLLLLLGFVAAADDDVEQWIVVGRTAPIRFRFVVQEVGIKQVKFDDAIEEPTDERIRELEHEVRELTRQLRMMKSQSQAKDLGPDEGGQPTPPNLMASPPPAAHTEAPSLDGCEADAACEWAAASVSLTGNGFDGEDEEGSFIGGSVLDSRADGVSENGREMLHSPFGDAVSHLDGTISVASRGGQLEVSSLASLETDGRRYQKRESAFSEDSSPIKGRRLATDTPRPATGLVRLSSPTSGSQDKHQLNISSVMGDNIVPAIVNKNQLVASVAGNAVVCLEVNYLDPDVAPFVVCVSSVGSRWLCPCSIVEHTYILFVAPAHRRGSVSVSLLCTTESGSLKRYTKAVWMEYQHDEGTTSTQSAAIAVGILHSAVLVGSGGPLSRHAVNQLRAEVPLPSSVTLPDPSERSEATSGVGDYDDFNSDNVSISASEPRLPLTREALDRLSFDPMTYLRHHLQSPSLLKASTTSIEPSEGHTTANGRKGGQGIGSVAGASQGTQFAEPPASLLSSSPTVADTRLSERGSDS